VLFGWSVGGLTGSLYDKSCFIYGTQCNARGHYEAGRAIAGIDVYVFMVSKC
jgi:hypothetical protein